MTIETERRREIGKTITEAMAKLGIDWTKESPEISQAGVDLDEAVSLYSENKASKAEVKSAYVKFRDAHKGGLF